MSTEHWLSGGDDTQIFRPPPGTHTAPLVASTPNGVIDEDVYCLECGYNLRGLFGDPVRCPECGERNSLGLVAVPAQYIHSALRKMETAPTLCTAFAIIVCLCAAWISRLRWPDSALGMVVLLFFLAAWLASCRRMRKNFDDRPGWRRILFDFHLATMLCTIAIPTFLVFAALEHYPGLFMGSDSSTGNANCECLASIEGGCMNNPGYRLHDVPGKVVLGILVVSVPFIVWGLHIYFAARTRLTVMQREAAVRIARNVLRRELHRPKRGQ